MGIQLVFVVETDERSRTDYIYINSVLEELYHVRMANNVKLSTVFMGGKRNYNKRKVISRIEALCKGYRNNGETKVIYCFDTDKYDTDPQDKRILNEEENYCRTNGYEFVWFCHDIEEVFVGVSVEDNEKVNRAKQYAVNKEVTNLKYINLKSKFISKGKSNLLYVIDKCL